MITIFMGGGKGGGWRGGSSERCLRWGGGEWGIIKGSFQKHLKNTGWVKAKVVRRGVGGFEGVTTPAAPENF